MQNSAKKRLKYAKLRKNQMDSVQKSAGCYDNITSFLSVAICLLAQTRYIVALLRYGMLVYANAIYRRFAPMRYVCLRKRDILSLRSNVI